MAYGPRPACPPPYDNGRGTAPVEKTPYEELGVGIRAFFDDQYRRAYDLIAAVRDPATGLYADAYWPGPSELRHMCSIAAVGVGLVALCIADAEGWEVGAEAAAAASVAAALGLDRAREPATGYMRHFVDLRTGEPWGRSEYSSIDTALLVSGALFAARYFGAGTDVAHLAQELYDSVHWEAAIADVERGLLHMVIEEGGGGRVPARPFNEYALVAHLARRGRTSGDAAALWERAYAPEALGRSPQVEFGGVTVLTDAPGHLLSSFVHLFPYYLIHDYTVSPAYAEWLRRAAEVDRLYWRGRAGVPGYVWGLGAGASGEDGRGYHADAVNRCPEGIASPHIVAGFLPVHPDGIADLHAAWVAAGIAPRGAERALASGDRPPAASFGLQRFVPDRGWAPAFVPLVDWSTMLYGPTAFRRGVGFFARNNNF